MNVQKIMNDITRFADKTFGRDLQTAPILHHLQDEVLETIEAAEAFRAVPTPANYANLKEEISDCFILLLNAASNTGMTETDILVGILDKMDINKARNWGNPDSRGVVKHIGEGQE